MEIPCKLRIKVDWYLTNDFSFYSTFSETLYEAGAHRFWVGIFPYVAFVQVNQTEMGIIGGLSFYPSLLLLMSLTMN